MLTLAGCTGGAPVATETPSPTTDDATSGVERELAEVVVAASPVPNAIILEYVRDNLARDAGIKITIKEFDDIPAANRALANKDLDGVYAQHLPRLIAEMNKHGYKFDHGEGIHISPLRLFSDTVTDLTGVENASTVAISDDENVHERTVMFLGASGLLTDIDERSSVTWLTAEQNPLNLRLRQLPRDETLTALDAGDVDVAVVDAPTMLEAGLDPDDAIYTEEVSDNPYAHVLAWRTAEEDGESEDGKDAVETLDKLLHSKEVAEFIQITWASGDVVPD